MPTDWIAVTVLPNVMLAESVEGGLLALAPPSDPRVAAIFEDTPNLKVFLNRFTDAFRQKVRPSVLLVRSDAPRSLVTVEGIAGFRDALSTSIITHSRALELRYPIGHRINHSDTFGFYPWMLDRHGEHLVARTPAMLALHDVNEFRGQSWPNGSVATLSRSDIDMTLFGELMTRLERRFSTLKPTWRDTALFRSLNMANEASRAPAGPDATIYDYGRSTALWVSAFEILAHPGAGGKSELSTVYTLLESVSYISRLHKLRRHKAHPYRGDKQKRRILACQLYGLIYKARNAFLHGNPVSVKTLRIPGRQASLYQCAAPLYRLALTTFLDLKWKHPAPHPSDPHALGNWISDSMSYDSYQRTIEQGLLAAVGKDPSKRIKSRMRAGGSGR
ncbi:UNVERIFIED_ORG: hypothetical protein GGI63_003082 [Rhizobium esperanzae]